MLGIGKSKARRYDREAGLKVTFDDVAGIDEAENELVEIVDFLKDPPKIYALGRNRSQRRAPGRRARHRKDPAGKGSSRGGRCAVLFPERCRIC